MPMVIHTKQPAIVCYVCAQKVRVAIIDETMVAPICGDCLPFCVNAGRALVRAGIPSSTAEINFD